MMIPLVVLAVGAVFAGLLNFPGWLNLPKHALGDFLGQSPSFALGLRAAGAGFGYVDPHGFGRHDGGGMPADESAGFVMAVSAWISGMGIFLAYVLHLRDRARAERLAAGLPGLTRLLEARYWVDEIYQAAIVEPLRGLGRAFFAADRVIVDGIIWALSFAPHVSGLALKFGVQRGYLQGYAAAMLFGVAVILLVVFL